VWTDEGKALERLRLLIECTRQPWSSTTQLAASLQLPDSEVAELCEALVDQALLQQVHPTLSHLPSVIYAPTTAGLASCSEDTGLPIDILLRRLGLSAERSWALRSSINLASEINALCALTARHAAPARVEWETFIQRRSRKRSLFLHGKLAIHTADGVRAFYLLNDRGDGPVTLWYRHLRYVSLWARRAPADFPTMLMITTRLFRAWTLLALARMAGGRKELDSISPDPGELTPPALPRAVSFAATAERVTAFREGLCAVAGHGDGWQTWLPNNTRLSVNPFAFQPIPLDVFQHSVHAFRHTDLTTATSATSSVPRSPHAVRAEDDHRHARLSANKVTQAFDPAQPPARLNNLSAVEALTDEAFDVLTFLCRHPVCPTSTVQAFTGRDEVEMLRAIISLQSFGLINAAPVEEAVARSGRELPALWVATEEAVRLRALRNGLDEDQAARRHRFFASDHTRRPYHTLEAHRFFERLQQYCVQRSRATRTLDAVPDQPDDGHVPYYDLGVYDAELMASDSYLHNGQWRTWRPDGYGALRCGATWTRFWLEIDGTGQARSRASLDTWLGKLDGLCSYYRSWRWTLRYPAFPCLLIVTTNEHNLAPAHDALALSARACDVSMPQVFMALSGQVESFGAMANVWRDITSGESEACYGFDNAQTPGLVQAAPQPLNLVAELGRAAEMGLLLPQPIQRKRSPPRRQR
jgi:hypothetical protein